MATAAHREGASGFGGKRREHDPYVRRLNGVLRKLRKQYFMNAAASMQGQPAPAWDRRSAIKEASDVVNDVVYRRLHEAKAAASAQGQLARRRSRDQFEVLDCVVKRLRRTTLFTRRHPL